MHEHEHEHEVTRLEKVTRLESPDWKALLREDAEHWFPEASSRERAEIERQWREQARRAATADFKYLNSLVPSVAAAGYPCRRSVDVAGQQQQRLRLVLADGTHEDERFEVSMHDALKSLFNDYAEKRGVSLRSLRFSYRGQTLFLSSVGRKSPEDLDMRDGDIIMVHDTRGSGSGAEETSDSPRRSPCKARRKNTGAIKNTAKGNKHGGGKQRRAREAPTAPPVAEAEEHKLRHSALLSRMHEEAQPRLKDIRTRLNALNLERQPPKRRKAAKREKARDGADSRIAPDAAAGGKAGRAQFLVRVGEESHLYRTARSAPPRGPGDVPVLDLHGLTREEALVALEERREAWVDRARRGAYPFVIPALIVCGGGNQILSETVQKWIKAARNVCNAPKNSLPGISRHV